MKAVLVIALLLLGGCATHEIYDPTGQLVSKTTARGDAYAQGCTGGLEERPGDVRIETEELDDGTVLATAQETEQICAGDFWEVRGGTISGNFREALGSLFALPGTALRAVFSAGAL